MFDTLDDPLNQQDTIVHTGLYHDLMTKVVTNFLFFIVGQWVMEDLIIIIIRVVRTAYNVILSNNTAYIAIFHLRQIIFCSLLARVRVRVRLREHVERAILGNFNDVVEN